MRFFTPVALVLCLLTTSTQAGLQNALNTALIGLRPININPGILLRPHGTSYSSPEDSLFIDPVASTRGEPVFRSGPEFTYDPATGGVEIVVPPMLGPADEFGIRQTYSANSVTVHADGQFAAAPALPQITSYRRAERDYSNPQWESVAFGAEDPSFVLAEDNEFFSVNFSPKSLNTDLNGYRYTHAGSELVFASLLEPSLPDEVFEPVSDSLPNSAIWPYPHHDDSELPDVYITVEYYSAISSGQFSNWYRLLAVPTGVAVPEPASIALAAISLVVIATRRNR